MLAAADRSGTEPKSHFTRYEKIYFHSIAYTCLLHIRSDSTNIIPFYFRFYLFSFSEQWMRVSIGYGALFATGFHFDVNNRSHDYELENWNSIFFVHSFDWFLFEKRECKRKLTWLLPSTQSNHLISWFLFFQFNCVKETYRRKFCCILFFHLRIFAVECSNQNLKAIGKHCIFSVEEAIFRVNGNMNWTLIRERDGNNSMLNICKWDKISSVWWQWNEYVWENIVVLTRLRLAYTSYACVPYPIKYHYIILYHCIRLV